MLPTNEKGRRSQQVAELLGVSSEPVTRGLQNPGPSLHPDKKQKTLCFEVMSTGAKKVKEAKEAKTFENI